eukprot:1359943-Amorphochlora_amoeboformis.AAC.1
MADNVAIFVVFSFISSAAEAGLLRGGGKDWLMTVFCFVGVFSSSFFYSFLRRKGLLTERFGGNRHSVDHILRTRLGVSEVNLCMYPYCTFAFIQHDI